MREEFPLVSCPDRDDFFREKRRYQYVRFYDYRTYLEMLNRVEDLDPMEKRYMMLSNLDPVPSCDLSLASLYTRAIELRFSDRSKEPFDPANLDHLFSPVIGFSSIVDLLSKTLRENVIVHKQRIYYLYGERVWKVENFLKKFMYDLRNYAVDHFRKLYFKIYGDCLFRVEMGDRELNQVLRNLLLIDNPEEFYKKIHSSISTEYGVREGDSVENSKGVNKIQRIGFNLLPVDLFEEFSNEDMTEFNRLSRG